MRDGYAASGEELAGTEQQFLIDMIPGTKKFETAEWRSGGGVPGSRVDLWFEIFEFKSGGFVNWLYLARLPDSAVSMCLSNFGRQRALEALASGAASMLHPCLMIFRGRCLCCFARCHGRCTACAVLVCCRFVLGSYEPAETRLAALWTLSVIPVL